MQAFTNHGTACRLAAAHGERTARPSTEVLVVNAMDQCKRDVEATKAGAFYCVRQKPLDFEELLPLPGGKKPLERRELMAETESMRPASTRERIL